MRTVERNVAREARPVSLCEQELCRSLKVLSVGLDSNTLAVADGFYRQTNTHIESKGSVDSVRVLMTIRKHRE